MEDYNDDLDLRECDFIKNEFGDHAAPEMPLEEEDDFEEPEEEEDFDEIANIFTIIDVEDDYVYLLRDGGEKGCEKDTFRVWRCQKFDKLNLDSGDKIWAAIAAREDMDFYKVQKYKEGKKYKIGVTKGAIPFDKKF